MIRIRNKRGQMAIWIILAIVLVGSMVVFFGLTKKSVITVGQETEPQKYIDKCAKDAVKESLDKILPQGGFIDPKNFKIYNNIKISYLCENIGNYLPCVNQHPMFLNEIKKEIKDYISPKIDSCFQSLKNDLEKKQNDVSLNSQNIEVSLGPDRVNVNIERKMTVSKGEETRSFDNYNVEIINPVYDLALVAMEIANQEAKYCYFEYVGYMILFPRFDIRKVAMSDSTKIYTIKDKHTSKELNIATRSCTIPAGF